LSQQSPPVEIAKEMMHKVARIIFCILMMEVPAQVKVLPVRNMDLDNTTLGVLPSYASRGAVIPQNPLLRFRVPQDHSDLARSKMFSSNTRASSGAEAPFARASVATGALTAARAPQVRAAAEGLNVFGEKLMGCENEGDICSYTEASPELCVRTGKLTFRFACKSIWLAEWKQFKTTGGQIMESQPPAVGDTTKCEAVPVETLTDPYTKESWDTYWMKAKVQRTGFESGVENVVQETVPKKSAKGRRFRKSIDFICQTCALYAESDAAKDFLAGKCADLGWNAENDYQAEVNPVAESQTETEGGGGSAKAWIANWKAKQGVSMFAQTSSSIMSNLAVLMIGLFVVSGVSFKVISLRRRVATSALSTAQRPLL